MSWFDGRKVVVPIDFSGEADSAVDVALQLAPGADMTAIHVAPDLNVLEPGIVWTEVNDDTRRDNLVASFRERFADPKYKNLKFEVRFGDPSHQIAEFAKEIGAGVIVMPSHGRTGLTHLLIGSVAERVVRFAHCPVLVLRD